MNRIIALYDDETIFLVETDAPIDEIEKAIKHKNKMLQDDDISFRSDFEEMQDYLMNKNYCFNALGYANEIEGYLW